MATLKAVILKSKRRDDGTYVAYISVYHQTKVERINTGIYVSPWEVGKDMSIKSGKTLDQINVLIRKYRDKINELNEKISINMLSVKELVSNITTNDTAGVDFYAVGIMFINQKQKDSTKSSYKKLLFHLKEFSGKDILYTDFITYNFIIKFEAWMRDIKKLSTNTILHYMIYFRTVFKEAILQYNDPELGIIRVKYNPFDRYTTPKQVNTEKRAVDVKILRMFRYELMDDKTYVANLYTGRIFVLARDMFLLSFYFCGINGVDLYNMKKVCLDQENNRLNYCRMKTKDSRMDKAFTSIFIQPEAWSIMKRYLAKNGEYLFDFHEKYSVHHSFNNAIGLGMGQIREIIGVEKLTYYSARHTWATIARNDLDISVDDIGFCLNHATNHKITDVYIRKDWSRIDRINRKIIDYVFPHGDYSLEQYDHSIKIKERGNLFNNMPEHIVCFVDPSKVEGLNNFSCSSKRDLAIDNEPKVPKEKKDKSVEDIFGIYSKESVFNMIRPGLPGKFNSKRKVDNLDLSYSYEDYMNEINISSYTYPQKK